MADRDVGGVYVRLLPDDMPVMVLYHPDTRTTVRLIPERSSGKHGELRSISYEQRPDVAVEVRSPDRPVPATSVIRALKGVAHLARGG